MPALNLDREQLEGFCRRHHIHKLSLFGSVLHDTFRPDSDIDVLVEFGSGHTPGFIRLHTIAEELSRLFGGRPIDLVTEKFLNPIIRDQVLAEARVEYAQA